MYIFCRWHPLTFIASNCFTLGNYDNSHGIWWLFKIQSCRETELKSTSELCTDRSLEIYFPTTCTKATWDLSKMLYWSYVSIKKFPPLLDCFQFVKLARILFESPLLAPGESRLVWYGFGVFLLNWIYLVGGCCPLYFRPSVTWAGHKASTLSIVVTNACHFYTILVDNTVGHGISHCQF